MEADLQGAQCMETIKYMFQRMREDSLHIANC